MGGWVVVERELRVAARRPGLYRWRVLLPAAVVGLTLTILVDRHGGSRAALRRQGWELFPFWSGFFRCFAGYRGC